MPLIKWTESMSVGVAELDGQHQALVALLNRFHDQMMAGRGREGLEQVLDELLRYTEVHFAAEERLFLEHGYPHAISHQAKHAAFSAKVHALCDDVAAGKRFVSLTALNLLRDWLDEHIMNEDMAYKAFFAARGVR